MFVCKLFLTISTILLTNVHGQEPIIRGEREPSIPYFKNTSIIYNSNDNITTISQPGQVGQDPIPLQGSSSCTIGSFIEAFGYAESGYIPPDPMGAAGKNRLVAVANSIMEVRTKSGTFIYQSQLASFFFQTTPPYNFVFDPKVIYDEHEGRFLIVALQQVDSPNVSKIFFAVSKDENPDTADAWYKWSISSVVVINGKNTWADYPGFEVDEKAVYITNNMFEFGGGFAGARLWIVPKSSFYNGGTATYFGPYNPFQSDERYSFTAMPSQVHGAGGLGPNIGAYLVTVNSVGNDIVVQIATVQNPLSSATFDLKYVNLGQIAQDASVPTAPQRGIATNLNTGSLKALDAVWRNNKLWVTFTINPRTPDVNTGQATAHWVRIDTTGGNFRLEAQGNLGGETFSTSASTYYPSIAVNKNGIGVVGYAASSPTMYGGAYGSVLLDTGTLVFTVKAGTDYFVQTDSIGRNRWGDYTGVSVDPVDDSFWIFNQYATTRFATKDSMGEDGNWRTAWARVSCTTTSPIQPPTPAPVVRPPTPVVTPPTPAVTPPSNPTPPTRTNVPCGLFGLSIFCLFSGCGFVRRLFGLAGC